MTTLGRVPVPHLLAAALCAGLGASLALRLPRLSLALAAAVLALGGVLYERGRVAFLAGALVATGWWWASTRLEQLDASRLAAKAGEVAPVRAEVTGPARTSSFSLRVPVRVLRFRRLRLSESARLELPLGRAPPQGAIVELVAKVALPRPAERAGEYDEARYLRRQGIQAVLRASSFRIVGRRGGLGAVADRLRNALARSLAPGVRGERRAVIAGIVLGEEEALDSSLRERFRASGLYHLLAVSGQNVAYVVGGVLALAWLLRLPRWAGQLSALAAIVGYVLAVGWQPSVVRAGVAGGLASLAWLAARPGDRWYFLLVGAAVLLAWNPYSLLEPGFQLSFAAVAAIFVAVPTLESRLRGYPVPRALAGVVAISVACGAATAPILWLHFGAVPLFSVAANALAAPVVAPLLGLGLAAAALEPLTGDAAAALGWLNGWLAAYLAACARLVGGLPHAEVSSGKGVAVLALAAAFALLPRLRPPRIARAGLVGALCLLLWTGWVLRPQPAPPPAPTGLRIGVLDVGQGDATLIQVPEGSVLVDQGPPEAGVAEQLARLGVRRLEALVLTHPSRDNIGGAEAVLERLETRLVLEPDLPFENPYGDPALERARARGARVVVARAGRRYRLGRLRLTVLWPTGSAEPGDDPNDHATVLLASYGSVDALLPADAESNVTLPLRPPPVEILKVAHHGSADPGLPELLELVRPRVAVLSVGADNEYGHPAPSTLNALAAVPGLRLYRTDEDGSIQIDSDGARLSVRTER